MALLSCPDCSREISDAAPACVHCGRPNEPALQEQSAPPVMLEAGECWSCRSHNPRDNVTCQVCGESLTDRPVRFAHSPGAVGSSGFTVCGWLLVIAGAVCVVVALGMDTSVGRVHNLSRAADQSNQMIVGALLTLLGGIFGIGRFRTAQKA